MGRALVDWYKATGEQRILDALVRAYADYPVPMGASSTRRQRRAGLCNLDAMIETYSFSGDRRMLERTARPSVKRRSPRPGGDWIAGRVVPAMRWGHEAIRLPALIYLATGEPQYRMPRWPPSAG